MDTVSPETYRTVISLLGLTLAFLGAIVYMLPVGECDKCAHCRERRVADATPCPIHRVPAKRCRSFHAPNEED